MCGITWRVNWAVTPFVTCPAADRIAHETTDQGLRPVTSETAVETMYEIALQAKDQTTVPTTSQTTREVIPQVQGSIWENPA